ncbi:hypothetical protein ULMS_06990 [Patiriisocius marinistellae]|uniref:Uncharacterized protein n=1 Tax=Patiriisocius marinistellae TaxID=2494560 RepID=A0A5J4FZN9_9FLAO|nr:hypothetical protein [Patiriisocius marinistellae]GEQ85191.1 hypothetical protein ULMS_06990 [Patiriisocius marinistellae]
MKSIYTLLFFLSAILTGLAQAPINYKAIINDANGNPIENQVVFVRFSINNNTGIQYIETHAPTTNANGLIVLNIGSGGSNFNTYSDVDWSVSNMLKVEVNSGNGYVDLGTSAFNAVPYAITALNTAFVKSGDNAIKQIGNVGVGTDDPQEQLHINDADNAGILITTDNLNDSSSIRLENGLSTNSSFNHYKIENNNDDFIIAKKGTFTNNTYINALKINQNLGFEFTGTMKLNSGASISEFSSGFIAVENSDTKIPTQAAVKSYVDQAIVIALNNPPEPIEKTLHIPFTAFEYQIVNNNSSLNAAYNEDGVLLRSELIAPLLLSAGATITSIKFYLRDNQGGSNIYISLREKSFLDAVTPIEVYQTQPSRNQPDVFIDTTTTNITIDANSYYYFDVKYSNGPSVDMAIIGAEITYTE